MHRPTSPYRRSDAPFANEPISSGADESKTPAMMTPVFVPFAVHDDGSTLSPVSAAVSTVPTLFAPLLRSSRRRSQIHASSVSATVGVTMTEVIAVPLCDAVSPMLPEVLA